MHNSSGTIWVFSVTAPRGTSQMICEKIALKHGRTYDDLHYSRRIQSCIFGIWKYIKCWCDVYVCVYGGVRCITGRCHLTLAEILFMVSFMYTVVPYSSVEYWVLQLELCYWSAWSVSEVQTQCPWYFTLSCRTNEWDVLATLEDLPI